MSSSLPTSWTLIRAAGAGVRQDQAAFATRYAPAIRGFFAMRWRVSRFDERVNDATQEVFLHCFRPNGALARVDSDRPERFRAFLSGVARTVAAEFERRAARRMSRQRTGSHLDEIAHGDESPSELFDRSWARSVANRARAHLTSRAAESDAAARRLAVLELRYEQGLAPRQIAERLELSRDQVYQSLHEAKADFRRALLVVLREAQPDATQQQLERQCAELARSL